MNDIRVDEHGVAHGVYKLLDNWWNQWCFTRHEDGVVRDAEITQGAWTCLLCIEGRRKHGREFNEGLAR